LIIALPRYRVVPAFVELTRWTVTRRLQNNLGSGPVGDRLNAGSEMVFRIVPEVNFAPVKERNRAGPPTAFLPRRSDNVTRIQFVEFQLFGVGFSSGRSQRVMRLKPIHHFEEVVGRGLLVREDVDIYAPVQRR